MTTGERLTQISGLSGVTAVAMLLVIGSGAATGDALVDYSGLSSGTAEQHLLADQVPAAVAPPIAYWDVTAIGKQGLDDKRDKKQELEILLLLLG